MPVPFIDIKRFEPGLMQQWLATVERMTIAADFIGGESVKKFETDLAQYTGTAHVVSCANGTDAMQLVLRALDIQPNDVVLLPNATFWATFEAVVNVGAIPVTVDIDLNDGGIDCNALEQALQIERPKACVIAHLYGWGSAYLAHIRQLCERYDVYLIEDGAQCFASLFEKNAVFASATIATTSFYPAKVLGAAGDAGAVFCQEQALAERVRRLSNHGRSAHYGYSDVGWNSRMDALQAAFLRLSLNYVEKRVASRRSAAEFYRERLPPLGIAAMKAPQAYTENGYCNVCLIDDAQSKQAVETALKQNGIGFANIYPGAISDQPGAKPYLKKHYGGHNAQKLATSVLNLPLFAYMTSTELDAVLSVIAQV